MYTWTHVHMLLLPRTSYIICLHVLTWYHILYHTYTDMCMHTNTVAIVTSSSMIVVSVDTSVVLPIFVYHYCAMVCLQHAVFVSVIIELWSIVAINLKRHRHCSCTKCINAAKLNSRTVSLASTRIY